MLTLATATHASEQTCRWSENQTTSLHQLFNVPVWTADLSLGSPSALAELERLVLAQHAVGRDRANDAYMDDASRGDVANNNFFGMQHADEAAWIAARDRCLFAAGSGPVGPAAATCEDCHHPLCLSPLPEPPASHAVCLKYLEDDLSRQPQPDHR